MSSIMSMKNGDSLCSVESLSQCAASIRDDNISDKSALNGEKRKFESVSVRQGFQKSLAGNIEACLSHNQNCSWVLCLILFANSRKEQI